MMERLTHCEHQLADLLTTQTFMSILYLIKQSNSREVRPYISVYKQTLQTCNAVLLYPTRNALINGKRIKAKSSCRNIFACVLFPLTMISQKHVVLF